MPVCRPFALLLSCREDVVFYPSLLVVHYLVFLAIEQLASWSTCQVMLSGCCCFEAQLAGLFCHLWLPSSFVSQARSKSVHCPLQVVVRLAAVQLFLAFFLTFSCHAAALRAFAFGTHTWVISGLLVAVKWNVLFSVHCFFFSVQI